MPWGSRTQTVSGAAPTRVIGVTLLSSTVYSVTPQEARQIPSGSVGSARPLRFPSLSGASSTVQRRRLGDHLRLLRESRGLTGEQAAERMNCSQSKISKIELGRTGIRIGELGDLLDIYQVTDPALRNKLIALAESGNERGWWAGYASKISRNYATYIGFESAARQITGWEPVRVPALLQTEDYARQVIRNGPRHMTAPEIEQRVEILMKRQAQVTRTDPGLWMITDESSLRRIVGGRDLMRDQLRHILQLVEERYRLGVQVLPFDVGAHPGTVGALIVLEFDADPDVVYVETIAGDLKRVGQRVVTCTATVHQLQEAAASHDESISMIHRIMKEL